MPGPRRRFPRRRCVRWRRTSRCAQDADGSKADLIDGSIGEASLFQETFGFYAHGVSVTTALLPTRLGATTRSVRDTCDWRGRCLVSLAGGPVGCQGPGGQAEGLRAVSGAPPDGSRTAEHVGRVDRRDGSSRRSEARGAAVVGRPRPVRGARLMAAPSRADGGRPAPVIFIPCPRCATVPIPNEPTQHARLHRQTAPAYRSDPVHRQFRDIRRDPVHARRHRGCRDLPDAGDRRVAGIAGAGARRAHAEVRTRTYRSLPSMGAG